MDASSGMQHDGSCPAIATLSAYHVENSPFFFAVAHKLNPAETAAYISAIYTTS
jgi:hypothetical protein